MALFDDETPQKFKWSRFHAGGYECSSKGDRRFSALFAKLPDGRTIEQHYQCDIKGYQPGGTNWMLGKGKPPVDQTIDLWRGYTTLWVIWAKLNVPLIRELEELAMSHDYILTDMFAKTPINQAHALAEILNHIRVRKNSR